MSTMTFDETSSMTLHVPFDVIVDIKTRVVTLNVQQNPSI
jgi:hypothetical protein